jgi:hypothetical protein
VSSLPSLPTLLKLPILPILLKLPILPILPKLPILPTLVTRKSSKNEKKHLKELLTVNHYYGQIKSSNMAKFIKLF